MLEAIGTLIVITLMTLSTGGAIYLALEIADIIERIVNNEGKHYASLSASLLLISAAGSFTGSAVVVPLIMLAIGVSSPVGWSLLGIMAVGTLFTALAHAGMMYVANKTAEGLIEDNDFMSKDFGRVQLTEPEAQNLTDNGIDPIKTRLAIALLRREIDEEKKGCAISNQYSFFGLMHARRTALQTNNLDSIRQLRKGDMGAEIKIGDMTIDLNLSNEAGYVEDAPQVNDESSLPAVPQQRGKAVYPPAYVPTAPII
ncbi:MAG: hypothetical protein QNK11_07515 [Legionella sp.]|nr:hypothetical protein [Legionella sp.]